MTRARDVARDKKKKIRQVKQRAEKGTGKKKRNSLLKKRRHLERGGEKNEGDEDKRKKRKGKLPAGEMERYQLLWPEAHTGSFALLRPSTAGANGVQTQLKLILESHVLRAEGSLDLAHH